MFQVVEIFRLHLYYLISCRMLVSFIIIAKQHFQICYELIIFSLFPAFPLFISYYGHTIIYFHHSDQGMLTAFQQQQMIQKQLKAIANTPFGDSVLFRNLSVSFLILILYFISSNFYV